MNPHFDETIQAALVPPPVEREPSNDLMRRLRLLARETPVRTPWWRSGRFLPAAMAGAAGAVILGMTLLPTKATAKSFDLVVAATQQINAFQFSIVTTENDKREVFTLAGQDGHVTMRTEGRTVMEIARDTMSLYDAEQNKIMRFKFGGMVDPSFVADQIQSGIADGLKEMDLKKMLQEYRQKYGSRGIRVSPSEKENGHLVYHVTLASPNEPERVEITVDDATDLPENLRIDTLEGGTWRPALQMEMRFGDRVDPSLLRSSFPANAKVEELDLTAVVGDAMKGLGEGLKAMGEEMKSGVKKP